MDIRDAIKPAISKSGLKQCVVAERIGLSEQQLCDISNKRRRFDANEMISFCKVINITPDELCTMMPTEMGITDSNQNRAS